MAEARRFSPDNELGEVKIFFFWYISDTFYFDLFGVGIDWYHS